MRLACGAVLSYPGMTQAAEGEWFAAQHHLPLAKRLQTHDQTELLMVLDELAPSPESDRNARAVAELLRTGQSDVVTDHALDALGRLRSREGRDTLVAFARHRRPEARNRAMAALAQLRDARDSDVLAQGLRDSAPQIRSDSARRLGELRVQRAADDLLRALELGVHEAAAAVGKLGDASSVERFGTQLGKAPLAVMLEGYGNYLERPDLPDSVKLRIVAQLEDVSGGVVKDFFDAWLARRSPNASPQLQQAVATAAGRVLRNEPSGVRP